MIRGVGDDVAQWGGDGHRHHSNVPMIVGDMPMGTSNKGGEERGQD